MVSFVGFKVLALMSVCDSLPAIFFLLLLWLLLPTLRHFGSCLLVVTQTLDPDRRTG